ncbi:MAG: hypothetical protein ACRCV9_02160 [Burkholderiaceae bacterium]
MGNQMTDRKLLEDAAKAAGVTIQYWVTEKFPVVRDGPPMFGWDGRETFGWNPLEFDADALWLVVRMRMDVFVRAASVEVVAPMGAVCMEEHGVDPLAAARRAIVRAAAAVPK